MWTITETPHAVVATAPGKRIVRRQQEMLLIDFQAQCSQVLRPIVGPPLDHDGYVALWAWWAWYRRRNGH